VPGTSYWAFISYSHHDSSSARWLQQALEKYSIPHRLVGRPTPAGPAPKYLRPIFRDRTDMAVDADLAARVDKALADSAYLIVVCSPHAAQSRWVEREIKLFRTTHHASRVLSVIVAGDPEHVEDNCFPPSLRRSEREEAAEHPEPLAADLRPTGDGRRGTVLKLCAGMLGVALDELVRRDDQRRRRRLISMTVASTAGMAIAGALAAMALFARNEAEVQRSHAEGLIEFMLSDLRKKLEPSGRLDLMDGVGRKALEYYDAQDPSRLDVQSLARRARALRLMGEINVQRGNLTDALESFKSAAATTEELLNRSPNDGQIIFNHAQNVFWVGEIARQRGNLTEAESSFQRYRALAERLVSINPQNDDWREEIVYADSALGVLYLAQGRAADALTPFERTYPIVESLAQRHTDDLSRLVDLGQAHAWLANALQKLGRLGEARAHRDAELDVYRSVLAKDPTFRPAKFSTVVSLLDRGQLAMLNDDMEGALADFKESSRQAETLLINEPENMDLTGVVAAGHADLGEALLELGQVDAARREQARARSLLTSARARDQTVALWRNYNDQATLLETAIDARVGLHSEALALDESMLSRLEASKASAVNTEPFFLLQRCRLQTGDELSASGRGEEARAEWTTIARSLSGPLTGYEPKLLIVLEAADKRLGQFEEADAVARHMESLVLPAKRDPSSSPRVNPSE
jgi:tetratricopeptide (TPR) repeat protein